MKLLSCLLPLLALPPLIIASAIPVPEALARREVHHVTVEKRQGEPSIGVQMGAIRVWTSNRNGRFQFRLLGGLRLVPALRALWQDSGALMARSFFTDFVKRYDAILTGFNLDEQFLALYKDHPLAGIVGLQFECFDNTEAYYKTVIDAIDMYFNTDNNKVRVEVYPVENAFDIGGRLSVMPMKRDQGAGLEERQDTCVGYDLTSMFRADIDWDPDADIYGIPMCVTPREVI